MERGELWRRIAEADSQLDALTDDWPTSPARPQPARPRPAVPAGRAHRGRARELRSTWELLGRPRLLLLRHAGTDLQRNWVTGSGSGGWDQIPSPLLSGPDGGVRAAPQSPTTIPAVSPLGSIIPPGLLADLLAAGPADDLLVLADDPVRALPLPLLPVRVAGRTERLVALAAVSLLPSLAWAGRLLTGLIPGRDDRAAAGRSDPGCCQPITATASYLSPVAVKQPHRWDAYLGRTDQHTILDSLSHLPRAAGADLLVIATHASPTANGSAGLREGQHLQVTPSRLAAAPLPPVVVILGCRAAMTDDRAPLHLAEAALLAGARHVIGATTPIRNTSGEEILLDLVDLLTRPSPTGPAQALQAAMQSYLRANPHQAEDLLDWSLLHIGLPGGGDCGQVQ